MKKMIIEKLNVVIEIEFNGKDLKKTDKVIKGIKEGLKKLGFKVIQIGF